MAKAVTSLVPHFGSNRMGASVVGELLEGLKWVGDVCGGGMSELWQIKANTIVVNDLNYRIINLARCAQDKRDWLVQKLDETLFHPEVLKFAQDSCAKHGARTKQAVELGLYSDYDALQYFISQWMGRSGSTGTPRELTGKLPVRWDDSEDGVYRGGGDSCKRFRSATEALKVFHEIAKRCSFVCMDAMDMIAKAGDTTGHGLYVDRDWPDQGEEYIYHEAGEASHKATHDALIRFKHTRVVVRYGKHPLIEKLYSRDDWKWVERETRSQGNNLSGEIYLVRNGK